EPPARPALRHPVGDFAQRAFRAESASDLALQADLPLDAMQTAMALLKTFEPTGIGARDLTECLLLQLQAKGRGDSLAARIVRDHFQLLTRRRIPEIARKTGAHVDDVQDAIEEIGSLDPAPGRRYAEDNNRVVVPDVVVEKDGDEWKIILNNDYIPRLRISNTYREMIARGTITKQERDYLRERIRSGKFIINSIEQRQQTIERITREIINVQRDFFEEGVSKLRPLTMTQIADAVGVHETTVSRAIANKFIKTPHGVFDLKYFFTPGYAASGGESVSNTSVKEMISELVLIEDRSHPLSDQDIVVKLKAKGINIARRTVAKYREELGLLPSNVRREYACSRARRHRLAHVAQRVGQLAQVDDVQLAIRAIHDRLAHHAAKLLVVAAPRLPAQPGQRQRMKRPHPVGRENRRQIHQQFANQWLNVVAPLPQRRHPHQGRHDE